MAFLTHSVHPLLTVNNLSMDFGGIRAIDHLNMHINQGKIVADDRLEALAQKHKKDGVEPSLEEIFLSLTEI